MLRYLVNKKNQAESTEKLRFPPPHVEVCLVSPPSPCHIFKQAITQPTTYCARQSLTSYRPDVLLFWREFATATYRAGQRECSSRPLNILTAREPMGLFAQQVDLISFTSYGADQRMQELELNHSRNWDSFTWVFGLLVKVVGSYTVDQPEGLIPGSLQLRQKSLVGQKFQIL